jgi:protoporphyrinogen oxidase
MNIAIIGAGFTGLSAGYFLQKHGHKITIYEKDQSPGGLAVGFKQKGWKWSMEHHYHHFFTNDNNILALAKEIGHPILIKRPKTSVFLDNEIYQLDSPLKALTFPKLPVFDRLRMGIVLAFLRYNPLWKPLEKIKAVPFLEKSMGEKAYDLIWKPQMVGKFGDSAQEISLAWFWARIKKRTTKLAYPEKGFLEFANNIVQHIKKNRGIIIYNSEVLEIESNNSVQLKIRYGNKQIKTQKYDVVIVTLPSFYFTKIAKNLPQDYINRLKSLKGLGAINMILRLNDKFFTDNTYWLSICEYTSPVMAIVEHTNFMDKKNFNNEHLVYVGKYVPVNHPYFSKTKEELLEIYHPFLKKINKDYKDFLKDFEVFKAPFAQPIIPVNYSQIIPPLSTPLKNVYLANIQQVYPWDRGTNYAVELGEKVANKISRDKQ